MTLPFLNRSVRRLLILLLAGSVGFRPASADDNPAEAAGLQQQQLFTAGDAGYELYRIPASSRRPTTCCWHTARHGSWPVATGGHRRLPAPQHRRWSDLDAPRLLVDASPDDFEPNPLAVQQKLSGADQITVNNPVAIADSQPGVVHFLYCVEYARCFYLRSEDDGLTFSDPVELTSVFDAFRPHYDWKVLATGPGHGIQMRGGRLVVPVWLSTGTGGHAHRPSVNAVIYSDDRGRTWHAGELVSGPERPLNPSETMAVELSDGSVMLNFRHESPERLRAVSISPNGATNWSDVRFDDELPEPVCMASLVRTDRLLGSDRPAIVFSNPYNTESRDRKNVTIQVSFDDTESWRYRRTLEPGPSGYSDLACGPDGMLYCLYERNGTQYGPKSLTFARFPLQWVLDGQSK
ncbi:MAG: sialidase family protein [Planctomycetaceae bacterium]